MKYILLIALCFGINGMAMAVDNTPDKIICFTDGSCIDVGDIGNHP